MAVGVRALYYLLQGVIENPQKSFSFSDRNVVGFVTNGHIPDPPPSFELSHEGLSPKVKRLRGGSPLTLSRKRPGLQLVSTACRFRKEHDRHDIPLS